MQEYERAVIFRLGRVLPGARGPGLFFIIPCMDSLVKKDLRTVSFDVPPQEVSQGVGEREGGLRVRRVSVGRARVRTMSLHRSYVREGECQEGKDLEKEDQADEYWENECWKGEFKTVYASSFHV